MHKDREGGKATRATMASLLERLPGDVLELIADLVEEEHTAEWWAMSTRKRKRADPHSAAAKYLDELATLAGADRLQAMIQFAERD
jgi:hypothetical protein